MPDTMFTAGKQPITAVRVVPPTTVRTISGHPVQAVRKSAEVSGDFITPAGYPVRAVRLVNAAGAYTTSQTPITTQPEDVFTPDGQPITAIRFVTGADSPELARTSDGWPIEVVQLYDTLGAYVPDASTEPDVVLWVAAVVANGGTVSGSRQAVVETFILAEKAAGTWALTDDYWPLWGEGSQQALTSLKQRRLCTGFGGFTFTADRGYLFNNTDSYFDTGFIPDTHKVAITFGNARLAAYVRSTAASSRMIAGVLTAAGRALFLQPRIAGDLYQMNVMCNNASFTGATSSSGLIVGSRSGPAAVDIRCYRNGTLQPTQSAIPTFFGAQLPTHALFIGAYSNVGVASSFSNHSLGFLAIGAALTAPQEAAQYTNVQAWATAIGANV